MSCYNFDLYKYDNTLCRSKYESCASWKNDKRDKTLEGCVLTKYCGVTAKYLKEDTVYNCPDGEKLREEDCQPYTRL